MANSSFDGPVRSENGFTHLSIAEFTGAETETVIVNASGELVADVSGVAMTTEQGSGMSAITTYSSEVTKQGKVITTHIFIDIAGLNSGGTAADIIGTDPGAANSHLGQIVVADSGQVFSGSMTCLEAPATGDTDIDLYSAIESTGAEDALVTALNETLLLNGGVWTLGLSQALTAVPAANEYLYIAGGVGADATYTAGQFLIELIGYEA
jgi:hypothetical protein